MNKRQVRAQLRENPEFSAWIKGKQDLVKMIKEEPHSIEELFTTWKKTQARKAGLKKIADNYRGIVDQVQELHTLLQRVDHIVNNVKVMAQTVEAINSDKLNPTPVVKQRSKKNK